MKYVVLGDWTTTGLAELVAGACKDGWEPQGGICYTPTQTYADGRGGRVDGRFYQAMIKRSE